MSHFSCSQWSSKACCSQSTKINKTNCPTIQHATSDSANNFTKSFEIYKLKNTNSCNMYQTKTNILLWCSFEFEEDAVFTDKTVFCDDATFHLPGHVNQHYNLWQQQSACSDWTIGDNPNFNMFCALPKQKAFGPFIFCKTLWLV